MKLGEHSWQMNAGDMEKGGVGKNAIEALVWKLQVQEVLMPDLAFGMGAGHGTELLATIHANRFMTAIPEISEVAAWPAPQVQDGAGFGALQGTEKSLDVLRHIVVTSALPKVLGSPGIAEEGGGGQSGQVVHEERYLAAPSCAVQ